jgi:hypothetical protein
MLVAGAANQPIWSLACEKPAKTGFANYLPTIFQLYFSRTPVLSPL